NQLSNHHVKHKKQLSNGGPVFGNLSLNVKALEVEELSVPNYLHLKEELVDATTIAVNKILVFIVPLEALRLLAPVIITCANGRFSYQQLTGLRGPLKNLCVKARPTNTKIKKCAIDNRSIDLNATYIDGSRACDQLALASFVDLFNDPQLMVTIAADLRTIAKSLRCRGSLGVSAMSVGVNFRKHLYVIADSFSGPVGGHYPVKPIENSKEEKGCSPFAICYSFLNVIITKWTDV
ncbi:LOW QUALITY PROTEIN: hypothetical protein M8C21_015410, partial [Ambrosia artemisiifolia]